jgi:hypothetical protein
VAEGDVGVGPEGADDLAGAELVGGVGVSVEEVDDDGLAAELQEVAGGGGDRGFVQGREDAAGVVEALRHLQAELAGIRGSKTPVMP